MIGYVALFLVFSSAIFLYLEDEEPSLAAPLDPPVKHMPESQLARLVRQASAGDLVSQRQLGQMYSMGVEVKVDHAEAFKWLRMAGGRGDVVAASQLGVAFSRGMGVAVDKAEAASWWRLAADKGDGLAAYWLALAYLDGDGVVKSDAEAVSFCRMAAQAGEPRAQELMGYWYFHGVLLPKSHKDAFVWFRRAAVKGSAMSQEYLGTMYLKGYAVAQSHAEALKWFQFAVNHGSGDGCLNLSLMYFRGQGATKDDSKALVILSKGAMLGHALCQAELGRRLAAGDGVPADPVQACAWYDLSVRAGNAEAMPARDALFRGLSAAEATSARERAASLVAQIEAEKAARLAVP